MKGSVIRHQVIERRDESTGRTVKQLTSLPGNHHHLYFTSNSFTADNRHVLYISDHGGNHPNLFLMSTEEGTSIQLTDNQEGIMQSYVYYDGRPYRGLAKASPSYNPAAHSLLYIQANEVRLLDVALLEEEVIHLLPDGVMTGFTHLSPDGRYACVPYIDAKAFDVGTGDPFAGIREKVQRQQIESKLLAIDILNKTAEIWASQVGWITHVQFQPGNNRHLLYNHEGGMVNQRIWLYRDGRLEKIRDQSVESQPIWICHEMWLQRGNGVIYHGTLGVPNDPAMKGQGNDQGDKTSFVGLHDLDSGKSYELPFPKDMKAYGHFTASSDDRWLVTDGVIDGKSIHLCFPDWKEGRMMWSKVCEHRSSFSVQDVHPHPIFSHDNRFLLFTSDADNETGKGNLYLVDLSEDIS